MLFAIVVAMFTLFVNMGLSFFIVSGFYLILALLLYMFKDNFVKMSIDNLIIAKSLKSKNSDFNIPDILKKTFMKKPENQIELLNDTMAFLKIKEGRNVKN